VPGTPDYGGQGPPHNVAKSETRAMKRIFWSGIFLSFLILSVHISGGQAMQLSSSAFTGGGKIPQTYVMPGAGGKNQSLPLAWSGAPAGTKSFVLTIIDPHPVAHNWVHWLVMDIPGDANALAEGASGKKMPAGAKELKNSWGELNYGGPQPPKGSGDHPYVVTLYALSVPQLDLKPTAGWADLKKAMEGKILGTATITGYYGR
jgi:Raf kinase inhibitor-like YbhB/YbcL family protein